VPRQRKPYKVDTVHGKYGWTTIYLNRDTKKFFGEIEGEVFEADTSGECSALLYKRLNQNPVLEWEPFIYVRADTGRPILWNHPVQQDGAGLEFTFYRMEVAAKPDGKLFYRRWLDSDEEKDTRSPHILSRGENYGFIQIPYTEATWQGLLRLQEATKAAAKKLEELVKNDARLVRFLENITCNSLLLKDHK